VRNFLPAILVWTKGAIGGNRMVGAAGAAAVPEALNPDALEWKYA
jgi:hypothetical protein